MNTDSAISLSTLAPALSILFMVAIALFVWNLSSRLTHLLNLFQNQNSSAFSSQRQELRDELALNRKELREALSSSIRDLETRFVTLEGKVSSRLEQIGMQVGTQLNANLQEGFKHFQLVTEGLHKAEKQLLSLGQISQSVDELNQLLKLPHLRGNFGEHSLQRLLEDFLPAGSFEVQYEIVPRSLERVDAVVKFPQVVLPIDSKFPREQVLPLFDNAHNSDPERLASARKVLSETLRTQAKSIAAKYIHPEHGTTDIALMFLPSETLYFEVIRDSALWEALAKMKVFPVSPNTLAVSLQFIGRSMHYYEAAQNVKKIVQDIAKARKHFENFHRRFDEVGRGLEKAQEAFHVATRHLGTYRGAITRMTGDEEQDAANLLATAAADPALNPPEQNQ